jgi:hypothetical protein
MGLDIVGGLAGLIGLMGIVLAARAVPRAKRWLLPPIPTDLYRRDVTTSDDWSVDAPSADELLLVSARRLLDTQVSGNDILDSRVTTILGSGSTVLPVTVGLLNLLNNGTEFSRTTHVAVVIAIVAFVSLIGCAVISFRTPSLDFRPHIEDLRDLAGTTPGGAVRRWIAEEYILSIQRNRFRQLRKSRSTLVAFLALCTESTALAVAALATLI